jgi:HK97 family phage prohead protease
MTHVLDPRVGAICTRSFDFEFEERSTKDDGRTLEGYAATFNAPTRIAATGGDFEEVILPGAFKRSLAARMPVLQFDHGKDPRIGGVPIGSIESLVEDTQGLHVRARLYDHPDIERVRQAIEGRSIKGMSFRFSVPEKGDTWTRRKDSLELREIRDADVHELGPVVFPAYDTTSVNVRSMMSTMDRDELRQLIHDLAVDLRIVDLKDPTGRPDTRSVGDGDPDAGAGNGDAPTAQRDEFSDRIDELKARYLDRPLWSPAS